MSFRTVERACLPLWRLLRALPATLVLAASVFTATASTTSAAGELPSSDRAQLAEATGSPVLIGLDADMSAGAAQGGEAIRRGLLLAIEEINQAGGVLGRPLELVVRDHRGNPARGRDNIEQFAEMVDLVAVVGGVHTPVALAELEAIHKHRIIYLGPWAAGTPIVSNGYQPNYVFRVSVRDEHAGGFLIEDALSRGFRRPGLLLWRTGWGRSNEAAMTAAAERLGVQLAGVQWFNSGETDMSKQIDALLANGADVVMLVCNPPDGITALRSMHQRAAGRRLPIISHWGITGGAFFAEVQDYLADIDLSFLQTYSFFEPPFPDRAAKLSARYCARFGGCQSPAAIMSPVGTAHAYDLAHILSKAIEKAGSLDRAAVRDALEQLDSHAGLVRDYAPPFTPERHDALDARDFRLARFGRDGAIVPIGID